MLLIILFYIIMSDKRHKTEPLVFSLKKGVPMKHKFILRICAAVMMLSIMFMMTACSTAGNETVSGNESNVEYVIRLGHSDTEDNLINISLQHYADWVNEKTGGRVVVRLYPNETIGDNTDMAQQLVTGELDAMMMPQGVEAKYAPKIAALGLPFLFNSYEQAWAVTEDDEIAAGLTEGLDGYNMIQLAFWENGMRQITNNSRAIKTPSDVEGLRMRIPEDAMTASIFKVLGAEATTFAWSRTYDALKQGIFDGQENPIANIYSNKINEVNKYMTITNHKYETKNLVFSLSTWKKLPKEIQDILMEGGRIYGQEHREAVAAEETRQLEELKKAGMTINEEPDLEAFKIATRSVYTNFELQNEWTAGLVARIREVASQTD